jgi:cell division protein FtsW
MFRTLGERTAVNPVQGNARRRNNRPAGGLLDLFTKRTTKGIQSQVLPIVGRRAGQLKIDVPLLLTVITLLIFGLMMVYSASYDYSYNWYGDPYSMFRRQLMWLVVGIIAALALIFVDYHRWRGLSVPGMVATLGMLAVVLVLGNERNGATRTLFGSSGQPSEFAKLMIIIYLAVWLDAKPERRTDVSFGLIPLAAMLGLLGGMIFLQPDLSAVVTIFALGGLMFFLAGGDLRHIVILLIIALFVTWGVVKIHPTGVERIQSYFAGLKDPILGSDHVKRAFEAFVKGGWFGVGIGNAETKLTGLPVPPTDSIFAVVGEETGAFGAIGVVGLYAMMLWRGLTIARRAPDTLGSLIAAGLTLWITIEAFVNMAVMVNLVPFAGNALPFISAGGSNLLASLLAIGILLNISRLSEQRKEEHGKLFNAVVSLRGRDRRRSISSASRPASHSK